MIEIDLVASSVPHVMYQGLLKLMKIKYPPGQVSEIACLNTPDTIVQKGGFLKCGRMFGKYWLIMRTFGQV